MLKAIQERMDEDDSFTLVLVMVALSYLAPSPNVGMIFGVAVGFVATRRVIESKLHFH